MSNLQPPTIPDRTSSWAAFEARRLKHSICKAELKRKLSDMSLEENTEHRIKLRIEELELDGEEFKIENERLRLERLENTLSFEDYKAAKRQNSKRITSLGDDLWAEKCKLRKLHEQRGEIPYLSPDTDNAFNAALLRLYKDPKVSRKREGNIQSAMRAASIAAYASKPVESDIKSMPNIKTMGELKRLYLLRCTITGEFNPANRIRAAHIVPYSVGEELVEYIFGPGQGLRLNRPDNCLMMHQYIEEDFDAGNITICPVDPATWPVSRWKVILINQDARHQPLKFDTAKTVGDLDGKELVFRSDQRPASRYLYYHFLISLLLCRLRENPGWQDIWAQYTKSDPWPTPGRYLRQSMLLALTRCAGNADTEDFSDHFLDHGFENPARLNAEEENEIARRVMEGFEKNASEDESDDWEDDEDMED